MKFSVLHAVEKKRGKQRALQVLPSVRPCSHIHAGLALMGLVAEPSHWQALGRVKAANRRDWGRRAARLHGDRTGTACFLKWVILAPEHPDGVHPQVYADPGRFVELLDIYMPSCGPAVSPAAAGFVGPAARNR